MSSRLAAATCNLRVATVDGPVTTPIQMPRGPVRLRDLVPLAQRVAQVNVERAFAREKRERREVSCRRGCAACCRQIVPISMPEAFRLADHVLAFDEERRDQVLSRIDAVESAIQAADLLADLERLPSADHEDQSATAARYFENQIDCPFLHEESCGVYAERPLVCRSYAVTTPASWCSSPTLHQIRTVPLPPTLSGALSEAAASLTGEPPEMIPLSIAMRWVDAHAELGLEEWPAAEAMGALLRAMGIAEAEIAACLR
jgi:Fe-S-cluster containining protein